CGSLRRTGGGKTSLRNLVSSQINTRVVASVIGNPRRIDMRLFTLNGSAADFRSTLATYGTLGSAAFNSKNRARVGLLPSDSYSPSDQSPIIVPLNGSPAIARRTSLTERPRIIFTVSRMRAASSEATGSKGAFSPGSHLSQTSFRKAFQSIRFTG